jgi:hypothetical protein
MTPKAKARAFEHCISRGYLTASQIEEAQHYGIASGGNGRVTISDVRTEIRALAAEADKDGQDTRRHHLTKALLHIDDARKA